MRVGCAVGPALGFNEAREPSFGGFDDEHAAAVVARDFVLESNAVVTWIVGVARWAIKLEIDLAFGLARTIFVVIHVGFLGERWRRRTSA